MKNHRSAAFTLVELLVVIVIIGILAGIALPVFQKAQEKSKAISDMSNLRQLGIAVQAYKGDNDGSFFNDTDTTNKTWQSQLYPAYASTWKVFRSPFDKRDYKDDSANAAISYGLNDEKGTGASARKIFGMDSSKCNYPSSLILLAPAEDFTASAVTFPAANKGVTTNVVVTAPTAAKDKGTHSSRQRINALFADGHTEDILFSKFVDKATTDGLKRWINDTP